jgi:hypothetical protein
LEGAWCSGVLVVCLHEVQYVQFPLDHSVFQKLKFIELDRVCALREGASYGRSEPIGVN